MLNRTILLVVCLVVADFGNSQGFVKVEDPSDLIQQYESQTADIKSIKADFTQEKHVSYLTEPVVSNGTFYSSGPDLVRWEQSLPEGYVMLINKEEAFIHEDGRWKHHDLKRNRQFGFMGKMIASMVSGKVAETDGFQKAYFESDDQVKILLQPVDERIRRYMAEIELVLHKTSFVMDALKMMDRDGNQTILTFSNQEHNVPLDMTLFNPDE
jgi:outer membrane lipoprotein-sorting protein